jgi:hypothetical protein
LLHDDRYFCGITKSGFLNILERCGAHNIAHFEIRPSSSTPWRWLETVIIKK